MTRSPSAVATTIRPMASIVRKRPSTLPRRAPARRERGGRGPPPIQAIFREWPAKPSPPAQRSSAATKASVSGANNVAASARRSLLRSARAPDRAVRAARSAQLTPMPMTTTHSWGARGSPVASGDAFEQNPARAWRHRAEGHSAISARGVRPTRVTRRTASINATPATNPSCGARLGRESPRERGLREDCRAAKSIARPRRPRPRVCRPATIQTGRARPRRSSRLALVIGGIDLLEAKGAARRARALSHPSSTHASALKTAISRRLSPRPSAAPDRPRSQAGRSTKPPAPRAASRRTVESRRRLVEIHDLDDPKIVIGGDRARQHADAPRADRAPRRPRRRST